LHHDPVTTTAPEAAIITALADYLRDGITAEADLADSEVVDAWPDPSTDLRLAQNRVVVAVLRAGRSDTDDRLGGPQVERVTLTTSPAGTVRYDFGEIEQPITVGLWACRPRLRDDVDLLIHGLLNRPMWSTIAPRALTTLGTAITKVGSQLVVPASMADIWPGCVIAVGSGASLERVTVSDIRATGFVATMRKVHAAGVVLEEVESRRETAAAGLHLRAADHHSNRCFYLFDDGVQVLDDAEGGRVSQRQEWRSLRTGTGAIRFTREVAGVVLQKRLLQTVHVSTEGGEVADPVERQVFP
jgi:hypothetical protein